MAPIIQAKLTKCKTKDEARAIISAAPKDMQNRLKRHAITVFKLKGNT